MNIYTPEEFLDTLDSIALQYERLKEVFGTGEEEDSISKACKVNFERQTDLAGLIEKYDTGKGLLDYANAIYKKFKNNYIPYYYREFLAEIDRLERINDVLTANDDRVHPNIKTICDALNISLAVSNIMPPPITDENALGKYEIAEDTGTFTDGESIDITQYGKAFLKVRTLTKIGGDYDLVLTIKCKKIDNSTVDKEVTITKNTEAGEEILIGSGDKSDMFIDVTEITHSTGNNGDSIKVISIWERELSE